MARSRLLLLILLLLPAFDATGQVPLLRPMSEKELPTALRRAREGDVSAQYKLGLSFQYGIGVTQDLPQAERWLRMAAGFGNPHAQLQLGLLYLQPEVRSTHAGEAMRWFLRAAAGGVVEAEYNIGLMYLRGLDTSVNNSEAERWLRKAVGHGYLRSGSLLGLFLVETAGSDKQRQREGLELLLNTAEHGNPEGQNSLGFCYEFGLGTDVDIEKALKWYHRAAKAGHADAMHALGLLYRAGNGVQQNLREAFSWNKRACDAGHAGACGITAYMYLKGEGTEVNPVLGYAYVNVSGGSAAYLAKIAALLSEQDKVKALAEVERWRKLHAVKLSTLPQYIDRKPQNQVSEVAAGN